VLCAVIVAVLPLGGCSEEEEAKTSGYEPARLEAKKGSELKRVSFTAEGARRTGLEIGLVRQSGTRQVVPYAALIYDAEGKTYVYMSPKPLSYLREPVTVERIEGRRALLSDGPPAGTQVVTTGAAEVYGTELEVAEE
jgi:hypothetical protein